MRIGTLGLAAAALPFIYAGSCAPTIEEFTVRPPAVCPGATVTARLIASDLSGSGRLTVAPAPVGGAATRGIPANESLFAFEHTVSICRPTTFDVLLTNSGASDCVDDDTVCDTGFADLVVEPHVQTENGIPCDGFPGRVRFELEDTVSIQTVDEVTNCGSRSVEISCPGGGTVSAAPGETVGDGTCVSGAALGATWRARMSLRFPEGCPVEGEARPGPDPSLPPPVCLRFEASCPETDVCG